VRVSRGLVAALLLVGLLLPGAPALAGEAGESVRGVIQRQNDEGEQEPVEGVVISVSTADGEEVGSVTTDAEGAYELALPGPGDYTATIDVDSLPPDTTLRNPDQTTLEFSIRPNQSRPLLFPLGEGNRAVSGVLGQALGLSVSGIRFGLIIAMCAIGLSLIFGTTGLVNFAHGELVTFGAVMAWFFNATLGIHLVPAALLALVVGGLAAGALDRGLWHPLRERGTGLIAMLVISIGLSIFLRYLILYQFGGRTQPYAQYAVQRSFSLGPVSITPVDLFSIVLSVVVLIGVALVLQRTRIGKAMRAVADNKDLAESSGVDAERVILFVWIFGGGLAALGGILLGLAEQVGWLMGFQLLLLMFAAITLGGLGTAYGALAGSLVIGIGTQLSTLVVPNDLRTVVALAVLILVLLVRPQGIFGQAERIG
jgi:branched-chain amino acid transport system permease protein